MVQQVIQHTIRPLRPGDEKTISIRQSDTDAVQYEVYIPASVWSHSATEDFVGKLGRLAPGATIFKGTTGVWKSEEEDVHIYRLILGGDDFAAQKMSAGIRKTLFREIGELMAKLFEWDESRQKAFLFTEQTIHMGWSEVTPSSLSLNHSP